MEGIHHRSYQNERIGLDIARNFHANKMQTSRRVDLSSVKQHMSRTSESSKKSVNSWWKSPEMKRRRRVAKYKIYAVEGKVKDSLKKGYKWFKTRCSRLVSGF